MPVCDIQLPSTLILLCTQSIDYIAYDYLHFYSPNLVHLQCQTAQVFSDICPTHLAQLIYIRPGTEHLNLVSNTTMPNTPDQDLITVLENDKKPTEEQMLSSHRDILVRCPTLHGGTGQASHQVQCIHTLIIFLAQNIWARSTHTSISQHEVTTLRGPEDDEQTQHRAEPC